MRIAAIVAAFGLALVVRAEAEPLDRSDRLHGGVLGEMIGLNLGQPVEGWRRPRIQAGLASVGAWPLDDYFPGNFVTDPGLQKWLKPGLTASWPNDDLGFIAINTHALERVGRSPLAADIADQWLIDLPPGLSCCTAELIAFRNLLSGLRPPQSGTHLNPYADWIGAQMRAQVWGLIAPGDGARAAELGRRDAIVSHADVGIDGEMFMAALIAEAYESASAVTLVSRALKVLEPSSWYAQMVVKLLQLHGEHSDWEAAWVEVDRAFGSHEDSRRTRPWTDPRFNDRSLYPWPDERKFHAIPNGAAVLLGVLYGDGDFSSTVTIAVMAGYDADNNGAIAGCVAGVMNGLSGIPARWNVFNDTWWPQVATESGPRSIRELGRRLEAIASIPSTTTGSGPGPATPGPATPSEPAANTDIDASGRVDGADVALVAIRFGAAMGDPRYEAAADVTDDGMIDGIDLMRVAADVGRR